MKYAPPIGSTDPNAGYVDRSGSIPGSPVPAAAVEPGMREIVHCIEQAGLTPDGNDLTQLAQAIPKLVDGVTMIRDFFAGAIIEWECETVPVLADGKPLGLELDGSVVSLEAYPRLSRVWCGSAQNATSPAWYRCTAADVRDVNGTHIKLQDRRGEFARGWSHGRNVDTGRTLGSAQAASYLFESVGQLANPYRLAFSLQNPDGVTTRAISTYNPQNPTTTPTYTDTGLYIRVRNIAAMFLVLV